MCVQGRLREEGPLLCSRGPALWGRAPAPPEPRRARMDLGADRRPQGSAGLGKGPSPGGLAPLSGGTSLGSREPQRGVGTGRGARAPLSLPGLPRRADRSWPSRRHLHGGRCGSGRGREGAAQSPAAA